MFVNLTPTVSIHWWSETGVVMDWVIYGCDGGEDLLRRGESRREISALATSTRTKFYPGFNSERPVSLLFKWKSGHTWLYVKIPHETWRWPWESSWKDTWFGKMKKDITSVQLWIGNRTDVATTNQWISGFRFFFFFVHKKTKKKKTTVSALILKIESGK